MEGLGPMGPAREEGIYGSAVGSLGVLEAACLLNVPLASTMFVSVDLITCGMECL